MAEVTPDILNGPKSHGSFEARDGNRYRIARGGYGPRGRKLSDIQEKIDASKDPDEIQDLVKQAFIAAMEPFYNLQRIEALFENDLIGYEQAWQLWPVVNCHDLLTEKKSSAELSSTPSAGA